MTWRPTGWVATGKGPDRQFLDREPLRCMYSGEILENLWRHKAHQYASIGVNCTRWGRAATDALGLRRHGTIWTHRPKFEQRRGLFFDISEDRDFLFKVPTDCVPYVSVREESFDEEKQKFRGDLLRGWRNLFVLLVKSGIFRPSHELSRLVGEDTWRMAEERQKAA